MSSYRSSGKSRKPTYKSQKKPSSDLFYGIHAIEAILMYNPHTILELFVVQDSDNPRVSSVLKLAKKAGISAQSIKRQQLNDKVSGQHQGVAARCKRDAIADENQLFIQLEKLDSENENPLILILDGVTDPQNLGSCLRSADALGVDAVIMTKDKSASLTPAAVKIASGAAETVKLFEVTNLARCIEKLKTLGIWIYGTALNEKALPVSEMKFSSKAALIMGAESKGLRQLTMKSCDELIYLPMQGHVDSLNVATAASVFLYAISSGQ